MVSRLNQYYSRIRCDLNRYKKKNYKTKNIHGLSKQHEQPLLGGNTGIAMWPVSVDCMSSKFVWTIQGGQISRQTEKRKKHNLRNRSLIALIIVFQMSLHCLSVCGVYIIVMRMVLQQRLRSSGTCEWHNPSHHIQPQYMFGCDAVADADWQLVILHSWKQLVWHHSTKSSISTGHAPSASQLLMFSSM